jgi:peptide/nickel transport system permease protein
MTVSLHLFPYIVRMTHAAAREAFRAPHTRMAVLLGIRRQRVIWTYAMRPAAIPLVNAVALNMMSLLGGVIVVENVFGFPGVGQLLVSAIHANDTPTIQAITVVLGALFISISIVADVIGAYLNPRLRGT